VKLEGTYTFEAPRNTVWQAFLNPDILAKALPGTQKLEKIGENDYKGAMKVKVGPVQGQFQGTVTLSDLNPPESYTMSVNGRGPAGFMKGEGKIRLEAQGDETLMSYEGDAQVGGRIASVGQRLIDSTSKALTRQALENIHQQIKAGQGVEELEADSTPVTDTAAPVSPNSEQTDPTKHQQVPLAAMPSPSSSSATPEPSQTEFAVNVAKDVLDDLIPADKRPILALGLGFLVMFIVVEWWTIYLARRVAYMIEKRD
jgi:carbon monoxide dehydrogenase subunit G